MHRVCQLPLKLDEIICLLYRRPCYVTIAHTYIVMTMLKRYISCSSTDADFSVRDQYHGPSGANECVRLLLSQQVLYNNRLTLATLKVNAS